VEHYAGIDASLELSSEASTDFYTEQFLAACNDFDRAAVAAQAKGMGQ
jgi:hypothetical protein